MRHLWASVLFALVASLAPQAAAQCSGSPMTIVEPSPDATEAYGVTRADRMGRIVAPVMVNGEGPFRFIIDTGANRSALSRDLVTRLGLVENGVADVHTVHEVASAPMVQVDSIQYGGIAFGGSSVPVLEPTVLAGEDGLLGVDGMRGRRLTLDFVNRCIEIAESRSARRLRGWSTVRGELRFGHLVLIEGSVRDRRINVLLDTGSSASLANRALRDTLEEVGVNIETARLNRVRAYTAGAPVILDRAIYIPRARIGEIDAQNVVAFVGDFHIFDLWGLREEPTLLIGMDVLSRVEALAIDYGRGVIHFKLARSDRTGSRLDPSDEDARVTR